MLFDPFRCASIAGSRETRSGRQDCSSKNAHGQAPGAEALFARCRHAKGGDGRLSSPRGRGELNDVGLSRVLVEFFRDVSSLGRALPARLKSAVRVLIYRMIGTQFVSRFGWSI